MDPERAQRERTARVNGTELRVEKIGTGAETIVFAPALFTNRGRSSGNIPPPCALTLT